MFAPSYYHGVISAKDLPQAFGVNRKAQQYSSFSQDAKLTFLMTKGSVELVSPGNASTVWVL